MPKLKKTAPSFPQPQGYKFSLYALTGGFIAASKPRAKNLSSHQQDLAPQW